MLRADSSHGKSCHGAEVTGGQIILSFCHAEQNVLQISMIRWIWRPQLLAVHYNDDSILIQSLGCPPVRPKCRKGCESAHPITAVTRWLAKRGNQSSFPNYSQHIPHFTKDITQNLHRRPEWHQRSQAAAQWAFPKIPQTRHSFPKIPQTRHSAESAAKWILNSNLKVLCLGATAALIIDITFPVLLGRCANSI